MMLHKRFCIEVHAEGHTRSDVMNALYRAVEDLTSVGIQEDSERIYPISIGGGFIRIHYDAAMTPEKYNAIESILKNGVDKLIKDRT